MRSKKKLEPLLLKMAQEVLTAGNAPFMKAEREQYLALKDELDQLSALKVQGEYERDTQLAVVKKLDEQLYKLEQQIRQHEKDHYGMKDLVINDLKLEVARYEN